MDDNEWIKSGCCKQDGWVNILIGFNWFKEYFLR